MASFGVSAGASGAIFGLYGALLGFLVRHRDSIPAASLASLRKGAVTFIGYNLLYGLRPGVDMSAHLGGLATGFLVGLFLFEPGSLYPSSSSSVGPTVSRGELTPASKWRVPAAVAIGLALIAIPMVALPKPDDYLAEYNRVAAMEDKDLDLFNGSLKKWQTNEISTQQYADILEKEVLPPWRAEREAMGKLKVPHDQAASKRILDEYLIDREQSWQLTVDGLRVHNQDMLKRGAEKQAEADKAAAQLRGR